MVMSKAYDGALSDKQAKFTIAEMELLCYGVALAITMEPMVRMRGDFATRCAECRVNQHPQSTHISRLARDILIDEYDSDRRTWRWVRGEHPFYTKMGEFWVRYGVLQGFPARWGGEWGDYGHFSFEHNGVK